MAQGKVAPVVEVAPAQNADLVALEPKLRDAIVRIVPESKITLTAHALTVTYRSEKYRTHLTDWMRNADKTIPEEFPPDFAEFSLSVSVEKDVMYHRFDTEPQSKAETFGTIFTSRANLRQLADDESLNDVSNAFAEVPIEHWVYSAYSKLHCATSEENWFSGGGRPMTRYEFAVGIARCLKGDVEDKTKADKNLTEVIAALKSEFAPELRHINRRLDVVSSGPVPLPLEVPRPANAKASAGGAIALPVVPEVAHQGWQPRYEHLSVRFSYGRGMDSELVKSIHGVISDYSARELMQ